MRYVFCRYCGHARSMAEVVEVVNVRSGVVSYLCRNGLGHCFNFSSKSADIETIRAPKEAA